MIFLFIWITGALLSLRYFTKVVFDWGHGWYENRNKDRLSTADRVRSVFCALGLALIWPPILVFFVLYKFATFRVVSNKEQERIESIAQTKKWQEEQELKALAKKHDLALISDAPGFDEHVDEFKRSYRYRDGAGITLDWQGDRWYPHDP